MNNIKYPSESFSFEIEYCLLLAQLGVTGRREVFKALDEGIGYRELFRRFEESKDYDFKPIYKRFNAHKEVKEAFKRNVQLIDYLSPEYPALLREISDPPLVLYIQGNLTPQDHFSVGIVGSRICSFYGETQTRRFSRELSEAGVTIVSGLAKGIDRFAHEEAIASHGRTLAVLGCGIDQVYPKENRKLFEQVSQHGALISEYPFGTKPLAKNFPRRNRILAGLSLGVLVIEAHSRSGSSITAHQAMEQGREVFALPGPVDQLTSRGTHQLIREGALLTDSPDQILEEIQHYAKPQIICSVDKETKKQFELDWAETPEKISKAEDEHVIVDLLGKFQEGLYIDEILESLKVKYLDVSSDLLELEIQNLIKRDVGGKYFTL